MQLNEELCHNSLKTSSKNIILHCKTITYLSAHLSYVKTEGLSLNNICQLGFDKAYINMYKISIIIYQLINFIFTFKHWVYWGPKHKERTVNLKT